MSRMQLAWMFVTVVLMAAACDDVGTRPPVDEPPESAEALIDDLQAAYAGRDFAAFEKLLTAEEEYLFLLGEPTDMGEEVWGLEDELLIHQRMFDPMSPEAGSPALDPNLWLLGLDMTLAPMTPFEERTELYSSESNPEGLDPARWSVAAARYSTFIFLQTQSDADFLAEGEADLFVIEDLHKEIGEAGKFLLYRWQEIAPVASRTTGESKSWGVLKALFRADLPYRPALSVDAVITDLQEAYSARSLEAYRRLFEASLGFEFFLTEPTDQGLSSWELEEELRIHRRMFDPENPLPGEPQVNPSLWLVSISINLRQTAPFAERIDLYRSPQNPDGLEPEHWRAWAASYDTFLFFDTVEETDFLVEGGAHFVVVESRNKLVGQRGKFTLFQWEDLLADSNSPRDVGEALQQKSWTQMKLLYSR